MKISPQTSVSIGLVTSFLLLVITTFIIFIPTCDKVVYQRDLQAAQKNVDIQYKTLCDRFDRFEKQLQLRFDKIETKLDNVINK